MPAPNNMSSAPNGFLKIFLNFEMRHCASANNHQFRWLCNTNRLSELFSYCGKVTSSNLQQQNRTGAKVEDVASATHTSKKLACDPCHLTKENCTHMKFKTYLALAVSIFLFTACGGSGSNNNDLSQLTCDQFGSQASAQEAFNSGAKQLDGDNDGKACENLKQVVGNSSADPFLPHHHLPNANSRGSTYTAVKNCEATCTNK